MDISDDGHLVPPTRLPTPEVTTDPRLRKVRFAPSLQNLAELEAMQQNAHLLDQIKLHDQLRAIRERFNSASHTDHSADPSNGAAGAEASLGDAIPETREALIHSESSSQRLLYQPPHKRLTGSCMEEAPRTELSDISLPFSTPNGSYFQSNYGRYDQYLNLDHPIGRNIDGTPSPGTCYNCVRYGHRNKGCRKRGTYYARRDASHLERGPEGTDKGSGQPQ